MLGTYGAFFWYGLVICERHASDANWVYNPSRAKTEKVLVGCCRL